MSCAHYVNLNCVSVSGLILTDDNEQESDNYQGNNHLHLWKKQHALNTFLIIPLTPTQMQVSKETQ